MKIHNEKKFVLESIYALASQLIVQLAKCGKGFLKVMSVHLIISLLKISSNKISLNAETKFLIRYISHTIIYSNHVFGIQEFDL